MEQTKASKQFEETQSIKRDGSKPVPVRYQMRLNEAGYTYSLARRSPYEALTLVFRLGFWRGVRYAQNEQKRRTEAQ